MDKNKTYISGYSDDNIEVSGALRDEIGAYGCGEEDPCYIACSDGTLLRVEYDDNGEWVFTLKVKGELFEEIIPAAGEGEEHNGMTALSAYSGIVVFNGKLKYTLFGEKLIKS